MSTAPSRQTRARLPDWLFDALRVLVTLTMVAVAAAAVWWAWERQRAHPWTRDGQVLGDVVHVAPPVSGQVVAVHVTDNQQVARGQPLFDIDPALYEQALRQAEAALAEAQAEAAAAAATVQTSADAPRAADLPVLEAQQRARAAAVEAARSALATARLKLDATRVSAPANGFVTNLEVVPGTYAAAGAPQLALIDADSFWVAGYFKETDLAAIRPGDPAAVVLMSYPDRPLAGRVQSIAYGIAQRNLGADGDLAPVAPTFEWIRLAQRIPVRIVLIDPPADLQLRIGTTASVTVNPSQPVPAAAPAGGDGNGR
jgi:multidrug resistance efflux pump